MANDLLAPFTWRTIDAGRELQALGSDVAVALFERLKRALARPHEAITLFGWYRGAPGQAAIPVYKDEVDGCFVVFVIDADDDGDRRLTLLHAGRIATYFTTFPRAGWHRGAAPIIAPRLKEFFG